MIELNPPHATVLSITAARQQPKRVHINQLKPYSDPSDPIVTVDGEDSDEERALTAANAETTQIIGYDLSAPADPQPKAKQQK